MANFITLQQFKDAEGIQSPRDDYKLTRIIDSVSALVKTYCGNSIIDHFSTNKVEEFNIDWDTHVVQLTESPVNTIVSVQKRDSVTDSYATVNTTEYYLDKKTDSVLYVTGSNYKNWPRGAGAVKVTYTAGYASTPVDLQIAVIDLINYYFKDEHKTRRTLSGATMENAPQGEGRGFPDHIKRVLDMYKNF
jgi:hypothetical protein|tara:strand:+ start:507 stop:1079 length:573 start_codon:yes stop_codon:yes gene_type:complete